MEPTERRMRRTTRVLKAMSLGLALAIPAGYTGISLWAADFLTRPRNHAGALDPTLVGEEATRWSVTTKDGLTLRGWYFPAPGSKPRRLVVLVHGMGDWWGKMAAIGRDLHRQGFDVLLFDLRGHGDSDPSRLTMGRRERADLRAVMAWAGRQGFAPDRVGWLGQSMGAAALLMEAADNHDIRAAVVDSPFGDLPELLDNQLTKHSHLPKFFNPGILLAAHRAFGVRTDDLRPVRSARAWGDRPLLLIHGEADTIVPVRQARALAEAIGPSCTAITLPGVEHVRAYRNDPEGYIATVAGFFREHLAR
jgi:alpha-beta hydrolase superfamily lysophospholipase